MAYSYYRQISIDHDLVAADEIDFPILVSVTLADFKTVGNGGYIQNTANGGASGVYTVPADLVFSPNPDGSSPYDFEIEKYNAATGELVAWVEISSLDSSTDTVFYVVYGDINVVASQEDVNGTWNANYEGVWHLAEADTTFFDSTVNGIDGTDNCTSISKTGKIGNGQGFDGVDDYVDCSIPTETTFTISCWARRDGSGQGTYPRVFGTKNYDIDLAIENSLRILAFNGAWRVIPGVITTSQWYLFHVVVDGASFKVYIDGYQRYSDANGREVDTTLYWGSSYIQDGDLNGHIDEGRMLSVALDADAILTEYSNQSRPLAFCSFGIRNAVSPTYSYYASITIHNAEVAADESDLAVLVSGVYDGTGGEPDLRTVGNGGRIQNTALGALTGITIPADLVFSASSDGSSPYDFEIERYNVATGELIAWVRIPSVSSGIDTVFYIVYGDSNVDTTWEDVPDVWDANYVGVWHLSESTSLHYDSTNHVNDIQGPTPTRSAPTQAEGQIAYGQEFERTVPNDLAIFNTPSLDGAANAPYLVEAWVHPEFYTTWMGVLFNHEAPYHYGCALNNVTGAFRLACFCGAWKYANTSHVYSAWYHAVWRYDGTSIHFYVNGSAEGSAVGTIAKATKPHILVGQWSDTYWYDGLIDELRISDDDRDADYITTIYNNQSDPAAFYTMGAEQSAIRIPRPPAAYATLLIY